MSSTRPRRSAAAPPTPAPASAVADTPRRSRSSRNAKPEPEVEAEVEDDDAEAEEAEAEEVEDEEEPAAGPSRSRAARGGRKARGRGGGRTGARGRRQVTEDEVDGTEDEEKPYRVRSRKSVSYREVPVEELEDEVDEEEDEDEEREATPPPRKSSQAPDTPSRRRKVTVDLVDEKEDKPYKFEKVGSGRGGFSVKGAAAAAARARWAKVRREKAERGEDDEPGERRKSRTTVRRENKAAVEKLKDGEVINIRGVDYVAHNDELPIPDDEKGETKIDAEGRLQGGREYKVFTFSSEGRDNSERLYGLTIDVARACGYSDSLAFLRRFPVIQKLQCQPGEAEMLIENGRVSGNMKHRLVTVIPMRNVFKLMGARIIKDAKWVTDDYYEDEALAKCAENGYTPHAPVHEEEIMATVSSNTNKGDREREALTSAIKTNVLSPFYTLGGPSTHFGGSGVDPWTEGGWGNRRAKLRGVGVTESDWMYRTALDCRMIDSTLRSYREERVGTLEGDDLKGWVWTNENKVEDQDDQVDKLEVVDSPKVEMATLGLSSAAGLKPPTERKRSGLSREVTFEPELEQPITEEALTPLPATDADADVSMDASDIVQTPAPEEEEEDPISAALDGINGERGEPEVRIETADEVIRHQARWSHGTGSWESGTIRAAYEPHTHMPHIPLYTQPSSADFVRASPYPILQSASDPKHQNFVQSSVRGQAARGLASLEYVFDPLVNGQIGWDRTAEDVMRKRMVDEAVEWEERSRAKRRRATTSVA